MKNRSRLTALLLALLMLMSALPVPALADDVITTMDDYQDAMQRLKDALNEPSIPQEQENAYTITRSAQIDAIVRETITGVIAEDGDNTFTLPVAGKLMLSTAEAAEAYQWQINADGVWANIVGDSAAEIALTYAKIQNALSGGAAIVRCALTRGGEVSYSPEAIVAVDMTPKTETTTVEETIPAVSFYAPAAQSQARALNADVLANGDERTTYDIVINYLFEDNEVASDPYTANLAAGTAFGTTVNFPTIQGYLPYVGGEQKNSIDLNYPAISENVTINVFYRPTNVSYTVIHYQQNVGDDKYTEAERETKQGLTKSTVPEVAKSYTGFYALVYERPAIAADGSTVIEVYYDRYYYLMNFDLDGGYGVEPIYARYGATIGTVATPVKAGYIFGGWSLNDVKQEKLPDTMPAENRTYKAIWTAGETAKVTLVVWGENADDEEYSYYKNAEVMAKTGSTLTINDLRGKLICGKEEHTHDNNCGMVCGHSGSHTSTLECYGITSAPVDPNNGYGDNDARTHFENQCTRNNACKKADLKKYLKDGSVCYYQNGYSSGWGTDYEDFYFLYFDGKYYEINQAQYNAWKSSTGKSVKHGKDTYYVYEGKTDVCTHTHDDSCYTCGKEEHTHSNECYYKTSFMEKPNLWKLVRSNEVTVAADGTTIMNVYYGRVEFTLHFRKANSNSDNYGTIKKKWGANIREAFNQKSTNAGTSSWSRNSNANSPWTSYLDTMPTEDRTYYAYKTEGTSTANYYVEGLDGKDKLFYTSIASGTGLTVTKEEFIEIKGFTFDAARSTQTGSYFNGAKFYYTRNSYQLSFYNYNAELTDKAQKVKYEAPLNDYYFVPDYPDKLEPNAYKFAGWYTTAGCYEGSEADMSKMTMPASDLMLYAKWVPVTHTVRFYLTEEKKSEGVVYTPNGADKASFTVPHGSNIAKEYVENHLTKEAMNEAKPNGDYNFVVWYWYDEESHQKHYFDPTTPIRRDMDLYGEWSSNTLKQYTVQYVLKDNPDTKVADDLTGSGLAGTTKTFDAKGGMELYAAYREGYFPTVKSQSLMLDINSDNLAITFEYVQMPAVPYTVKYINTEIGTSVFDGETIPDKVVEDNRKAVVTETFKPIPGYMPDAYQKRLVVTADGQNILYFYYTKDTTHAYYKITHYTENLGTDAAGNRTWTEYASSQAVGDIGATYTADPMTIPGFTYNSTVEGTLVRGELTANGLELKLYYTRNSYRYQVRYLEQGTGKELRAPKNENGKYGQVISENAIEIANYDAVAPTSQTLNIRIEENTEAKLNVITFYYKEKEVAINYVAVGPDNKPLTAQELTTIGSVAPTSETVKLLTGTAQGSTATLIGAPTYRFAGWYSDAACTALVSSNARFVPTQPSHDENGEVVKDLWVAATYYAKFEYNLTTLTITKSGAQVGTKENPDLDAGQSFLFKVTGEGLPKDGLLIAINGNSSETISGLTVGQTYTVTEVSDWSWRYKAEAEKITLKADASANVVTVTNNRAKVQWLDGDCYAENNFGAVSSQGN